MIHRSSSRTTTVYLDALYLRWNASPIISPTMYTEHTATPLADPVSVSSWNDVEFEQGSPSDLSTVTSDSTHRESVSRSLCALYSSSLKPFGVSSADKGIDGGSVDIAVIGFTILIIAL